MTPQRGFRRTLQKGFRRTGNPDLVNDIYEYTHIFTLGYYTLGIVQDIYLKSCHWHVLSYGDYIYAGYRKLKVGFVSEAFIRKFQDKLDWSEVSRYQKLSEPFIIEFQDKVDWDRISQYQKLVKLLSENIVPR